MEKFMIQNGKISVGTKQCESLKLEFLHNVNFGKGRTCAVLVYLDNDKHPYLRSLNWLNSTFNTNLTQSQYRKISSLLANGGIVGKVNNGNLEVSVQAKNFFEGKKFVDFNTAINELDKASKVMENTFNS